MTTLVRTRAGGMVHRFDCRYAAGATPWHWAEGRAYVEIGYTAEKLRIKLCRVCRPIKPRGGVWGSNP